VKKDWKGNNATAFGQIGARNFAQQERQIHDYYATPPKAVEDLLRKEQFSDNIWEPACGEGHISKTIEKVIGKKVRSTDLIDRGFGEGGINFLLETDKWNGDIITNPPYSMAQSFVEHSLFLIPEGNKVAMLLKIQFLEGKARRRMFQDNPPKNVYVWSGRISCALNGDFKSIKHGSPMMFAWFVWEKGFKGDPSIKWI